MARLAMVVVEATVITDLVLLWEPSLRLLLVPVVSQLSLLEV